LWQNFGASRPLETSRAILRRAFDLGVTHFDLANNYGPPYGTAEETFGRAMAYDFRHLRDEMVISTKAGYDMWPGPYGDNGSRKYLLASLDQSLRRMGLDYVDIFYSHRFDPATPLEETLGALATAVHQGKALYAGISSYPANRSAEAARIMRGLGTPILIHQPVYSMFNRWVEPDLLDVLGEEGMGCIAFSPLAQGLLTDRYLAGVPEGSRAGQGGAGNAERGQYGQGKRSGRNSRPTRAVAFADGPGMGAAGPACHFGAGRCQQHPTARVQRQGTGAARVHRFRARRDRPLRKRGREQQFAPAERCLTRPPPFSPRARPLAARV